MLTLLETMAATPGISPPLPRTVMTKRHPWPRFSGDTIGDTIFALIGTKNVSPDFTKPYFYSGLATRRRRSQCRGREFKSLPLHFR